MHKANRAKKDEFYTQLTDIEKELSKYKSEFRDKTVFCNCDDPFESNFFKYFAMNFNHLGLKKLICTCYAGSPVSQTELNDLPLFHQDEKLPYKIEITEVPDMNGDGATDLSDIELLLHSDNNNLTILDGDGDFRSEESIEYLKESDIVVTNPPFSLFREFVAQLMTYEKKFLIIGNINAVTYKEIFPLIAKNKLWLGHSIHSGDREFRVPDSYPLNASGSRIDEKGRKYIRVKGVRWFTNLDYRERHDDLPLYKHYSPEEYPKYDNYDAINVDKTSDIPCDYFEDMGVPITYLDKHNPDQFELVKFRKGDDDKDLTYTRLDRQTDNYAILQNHHQEKEDVMASWESQSHSSTSTIRTNSVSLESTDTLQTIQGMDTDSQSTEKKPTQESSLREGCNGVMGVPITFLDKYSPEQFEIIALGNSRDNFTPDKDYINPIKHLKTGEEMNGGAINCVLAIEEKEKPKGKVYYTADNAGYLVPPYARILIKRRKHEN